MGDPLTWTFLVLERMLKLTKMLYKGDAFLVTIFRDVT